MNVRFRRFFCFLALGLLLLAPVCAAGPGDASVDEVEGAVVEAPPPVVVQGASADDLVSALSAALADLTHQGELEVVRAVSVPMDDPEAGISPAYDKDDTQTAEPSGTLKSLLVKLIGPYNPVVVEYRYQNYNQSSYSYVREIQPDYVWFASAGLFALMVFCTFRLGGVLLRKI